MNAKQGAEISHDMGNKAIDDAMKAVFRVLDTVPEESRIGATMMFIGKMRYVLAGLEHYWATKIDEDKTIGSDGERLTGKRFRADIKQIEDVFHEGLPLGKALKEFFDMVDQGLIKTR